MNYTPKQLKILRLIHEYQSERGYSPTYAELAKKLSVSTITVFEHLEALERKGAIRRRRHEARSVEIIEPNFLRQQSNRTTLPLKGVFAEGHPIQPVEASADNHVGDVFASGPQGFALAVRGNSLIDEHILDGDILILDKTENVKDGELIIAVLDTGTATLRRYFQESGRIRLQPVNPAVSPLYVNDVKIEGVFRGIVRPVEKKAIPTASAVA